MRFWWFEYYHAMQCARSLPQALKAQNPNLDLNAVVAAASDNPGVGMQLAELARQDPETLAQLGNAANNISICLENDPATDMGTAYSIMKAASVVDGGIAERCVRACVRARVRRRGGGAIAQGPCVYGRVVTLDGPGHQRG